MGQSVYFDSYFGFVRLCYGHFVSLFKFCFIFCVFGLLAFFFFHIHLAFSCFYIRLARVEKQKSSRPMRHFKEGASEVAFNEYKEGSSGH